MSLDDVSDRGASPSSKRSPLPIIDITPYIPSDDSLNAPHASGAGGRISTASAIHAACLEYGFFYLDISHFVDPAVPAELAELAREFFHRPQEEKDRISLRNQDHARGYARLQENVTNGKADNHEGIDFYAPVAEPDKRKPLWGENQWPETPVPFREKYEMWVEKMKELGLIVMKAMADGLGMTEAEWTDLRAQVDDSFWVMRAIGYPPLPNDHDGYSCGAHKDYGCLTFLYADSTPNALQVFVPEKEGGQKTVVSAALSMNTDEGLPSEQGEQPGRWITADPIPGCVVCNIGEMWETWTNGLYRATLHRVVHRGSNYRVSVPFFFEPNFTARVAPLAAALRLQDGAAHMDVHGHMTPDVASKEVYPPVVYGEFLTRKVGGNFTAGDDDGSPDGKTRGRY